jgi:hypothetical protein
MYYFFNRPVSEETFFNKTWRRKVLLEQLTEKGEGVSLYGGFIPGW